MNYNELTVIEVDLNNESVGLAILMTTSLYGYKIWSQIFVCIILEMKTVTHIRDEIPRIVQITHDIECKM